jgi:GMP synthase-like glutamine amidotransferase
MAVPGATYIGEHLVVMALQLGRPLHPGESVWHISGDKSDNRPANLVLLASPEALKRTLSGGHVDSAEVVWRPEWTEGLSRGQLVERALGEDLQG